MNPSGHQAEVTGNALIRHVWSSIRVVVASVLLLATLAAQEPLAFDVVSVRRTAPGARGGGFQNPPGQFIASNYAIRSLIVLAYGIAGYQIGDLPGWTADERYDILGKTPPGTFTQQQRTLMIRALLADRFKLKTHMETRELPVYALIHARGDKKLGPALHPATLDCAAMRAKRAGRGPTTPEEMMECNFLTSTLPSGARRLRAQAVSLANLASMFGSFVDRPVFDRTGLTGEFDVDLTFLPQAGGPAPGDPGDVPFIFTAIQEQLGLKLESTKTPIEVLVIDAIERPSEN